MVGGLLFLGLCPRNPRRRLSPSKELQETGKSLGKPQWRKPHADECSLNVHEMEHPEQHFEDSPEMSSDWGTPEFATFHEDSIEGGWLRLQARLSGVPSRQGVKYKAMSNTPGTKGKLVEISHRYFAQGWIFPETSRFF